MSVQEQILEALKAEIDSLSNYANILYGALDDGNSLALIPDGCNEPDLPEEEQEFTLGGGGFFNMHVTLKGRHEIQATVRDTLYAIHEHLNRMTDYPTGTNWTVCSIATYSAPAYAGLEDTHWVYDSVLTIQYYLD